MELTISLIVLATAAVAGCVVVQFIVKRLRSIAAVWFFVVVIWFLALAGILTVDVNVPLSESHLRPSGRAAPSWIASLAFLLRSGAIAAIVFGTPMVRRLKSSEPNQPLNAIAPKDGAPR